MDPTVILGHVGTDPLELTAGENIYLYFSAVCWCWVVGGGCQCNTVRVTTTSSTDTSLTLRLTMLLKHLVRI